MDMASRKNGQGGKGGEEVKRKSKRYFNVLGTMIDCEAKGGGIDSESIDDQEKR
jgi:hypothetical protein